MERVDAVLHGWEQAPYATKAEVDANYKRCVDFLLTTEAATGLRVGVASHNLFDLAWALLLARDRGLEDRIEFEMLQGIATPRHGWSGAPATGCASTPRSSPRAISTWRSATCSGASRRTRPPRTTCTMRSRCSPTHRRS